MTIPTITIYRGIYYGGYDTFGKSTDGFFSKMAIAWGITAIANTVIYPFNTLRVRMLMTTGENKKYSGWASAVKSIQQKEGLLSLYRGLGANFLKNIGSALVIVGYAKFFKNIKKI